MCNSSLTASYCSSLTNTRACDAKTAAPSQSPGHAMPTLACVAILQRVQKLDGDKSPASVMAFPVSLAITYHNGRFGLGFVTIIVKLHRQPCSAILVLEETMELACCPLALERDLVLRVHPDSRNRLMLVVRVLQYTAFIIISHNAIDNSADNSGHCSKRRHNKTSTISG